jgi:DNA polymerase-4
VRFKKHLGNAAEHLQALARGDDRREVTPDHGAKSVGQERTFEEDLEQPADVLRVLLSQADQVGRRLRANGLRAAGVTVKIRFGEFETITRATTLPQPTDASGALRDAAAELFGEWSRRAFQPVRLIGVAAGKLTAARPQLALFPDAAEVRGRKLDAALDRIQDKFGSAAIRRGE